MRSWFSAWVLGCMCIFRERLGSDCGRCFAFRWVFSSPTLLRVWCIGAQILGLTGGAGRERSASPESTTSILKYSTLWSGRVSCVRLLPGADVSRPDRSSDHAFLCRRAAAVAAMIVLTIVCCAMLFGTYAHRLGHVRARSRVVRVLQRCHLLLDIGHHRHHHCRDHLTHYCVINGWANVVCDRIGFWRFLEIVIHRVTRRRTAQRRYALGKRASQRQTVGVTCPGTLKVGASRAR